jgi:hypothetical protein
MNGCTLLPCALSLSKGAIDAMCCFVNTVRQPVVAPGHHTLQDVFGQTAKNHGRGVPHRLRIELDRMRLPWSSGVDAFVHFDYITPEGIRPTSGILFLGELRRPISRRAHHVIAPAIHSPQDLRRLSPAQFPELAQEIR